MKCAIISVQMGEVIRICPGIVEYSNYFRRKFMDYQILTDLEGCKNCQQLSFSSYFITSLKIQHLIYYLKLIYDLLLCYLLFITYK